MSMRQSNSPARLRLPVSAGGLVVAAILATTGFAAARADDDLSSDEAAETFAWAQDPRRPYSIALWPASRDGRETVESFAREAR